MKELIFNQKRTSDKSKKDKIVSFIRSPLRYPGGKSRAVSQMLNEYFPKKLPTLCSPFLGGGSIELALANRGTRVYAYDAFEPLVIFWQVLLKDASNLAKTVRKYKLITPTIFYLSLIHI